MKTRLGLLGLSLALAVIALSDLRADAQQRQPDLARLQQQFGNRTLGPLLTQETKDKLNLTADQKEKIAKVEKEYDAKAKEANDKIQETLKKAVQDKDITGIQGLREMMQTNQKIKADYESKVAAVLNDEQKKKFEEAQRTTTRRPGTGTQPGFQFPGRGGEQNLQSKEVQEKLNLNEEQKKKLETLQKEFETKSLEVLNAEQKKQFEELKKQPTRPSRRPVPPGNR